MPYELLQCQRGVIAPFGRGERWKCPGAPPNVLGVEARTIGEIGIRPDWSSPTTPAP